ncbi:MAG: hypothetical protein EA398_12905 [Deltaproteobacteria bacterium]|nr:MAG: hypothetical protein EA398_12905 [Deltaproteobacteria bacterium]
MSPLFATGCDQPDPEEEARQARIAELRTQIDLPEVPPLDALELPARMPDGSWSVAGILRNRGSLMDGDVEVSALLQELYVCEGATEDSRAGCLHPHFFIADSVRSPQRLLAAGHDIRYEEQLEVGARYTFVGQYTQRTRGHVSTEDGLIVISEIRGENVEPPPEDEEGVD